MLDDFDIAVLWTEKVFKVAVLCRCVAKFFLFVRAFFKKSMLILWITVSV